MIMKLKLKIKINTHQQLFFNSDLRTNKKRKIPKQNLIIINNFYLKIYCKKRIFYLLWRELECLRTVIQIIQVFFKIIILIIIFRNNKIINLIWKLNQNNNYFKTMWPCLKMRANLFTKIPNQRI